VEVQFVSANPPGRYNSATHDLVWGPLTLTTGAQLTGTVMVNTPVGVQPCRQVTNTARLFHPSLAQPLVAEATHYPLPCEVYLPIIAKGD
jgi:hypothetical protein